MENFNNKCKELLGKDYFDCYYLDPKFIEHFGLDNIELYKNDINFNLIAYQMSEDLIGKYINKINMWYLFSELTPP